MCNGHMTSIDPRTIVAAKRDGETLPAADIESFIEGYVRGDISDALSPPSSWRP